jgi:cytochrome c-type biogenesis protein CcmH/NrfG
MAYLRRGDFVRAEQAADLSLRSAAKPAASLALLGNICMYKGDHAGGVRFFERALMLEPHELEWRLYLAGAQRLQGRLQEACDLLRGASEPDPPKQARLKEALEGCAT